MRLALVALIALSACHADPEPRANRAAAFFYRAATVAHASEDKPTCSDWQTGSADVAWCSVDKTWFYCTAGDARFEKDETGKWTNLGEPRCAVKISPPSPPAPQAPATPPQAPQAPPPPPAPVPSPSPPPAAAGPGAHP